MISPTPWRLTNTKDALPGAWILDANGHEVFGWSIIPPGQFLTVADSALRIVACVNAMDGIDNPMVAAGWYRGACEMATRYNQPTLVTGTNGECRGSATPDVVAEDAIITKGRA